ncbi:MAG: DNA recombination protein RmuC [Patescibacteria group bacterium]
MSIIEIVLLVSSLISSLLLTYLILKNRSSQSNDPTPLIISLSNTISDKFDKVNEKQKDHQFEIKEVLNTQNNEGREKIFSSIRVFQTEINEILTSAIQGLQQSNKIELDKLSSLSKHSFDQIYEANNKKLEEIQKEIEKRLNENLENNLRSFKEVSNDLGNMKATAQRMIDSTSSIDKLNKIFDRTASKSFGGFSEQYLEQILEYHLKGLWKKQATIKDGREMIDFVIEFDTVRIGIDSKFALTAYNDFINSEEGEKGQKLKEYLGATRNMATSISTKYGGHFNHLLMFIPSDSMFAEVTSDQMTMDKLHRLRITPISPSTLLTVVYSISMMKDKIAINSNAHMIQDYLIKIEKSLYKFKEEYEKLGKKLKEAQDTYDKSNSHVNQVELQIGRVKKLEIAAPRDIIKENDDSMTLESGQEQVEEYAV